MAKRIRKNRYKRAQTDEPTKSVFKRTAETIFMILCAVAFVGAMSLLFIFGHDFLTQWDYFKAKNIIIRGDTRFTAEDIIKESRIKKGANILSINLTTVKKRLLANPWIAKADVYREFPGSIIIVLKEQKSLAAIDLGTPFLINQQGDIFKEAPAGETAGLPVITGIDYSDWKIPKMPATHVFEAVMEILRTGQRESGVIPNNIIKTIQVDKEIGVTLQTQCPIEFIKLGYGNFKTKYDRVVRIFSYISQNETVPALESIDLRNPDNVVACLNKNQSPEESKKEGLSEKT